MRNFFYITLSLLGIAVASNSSAQQVSRWWYFGDSAGVHFLDDGPISDPNSQMFNNESCSAVDDNAGNLLFYSGTERIYNRDHQIMLNGDSLTGDNNASQGNLIIKKPGSQNVYYVFYIDQPWGLPPQTGFVYSVVDMNLDGGLGGVLSGLKNIPVYQKATERVAAMRSSSFQGYWISIVDKFEPKILSYKLTPNGLDTTPVISSFLCPYAYDSTNSTQGGLKFSPDGRKACLTIANGNPMFAMFDFDPTTGAFNLIGFYPVAGTFSNRLCEFSPDSRYLYISSGMIHQLDLDALSDSTNFVNSSTLISPVPSANDPNHRLFGIQLGPDDKIYIARNQRPYLDIVHSPNEQATNANYEDSALYLNRNARFALPYSLNLTLRPKFRQLCAQDTTWFNVNPLYFDSINWKFQNGSSIVSMGTGSTLGYVFSDTGDIIVLCIGHFGIFTDTVSLAIHILPNQTLDLGPDTSICKGSSISFDVSQPRSIYLWSSGSSDSTYTTDSDTLIAVTIFGACDTLSDTIHVWYQIPLSVNLGPDTLICADSFLLLPEFTSIDSNFSIFWLQGNDTILKSKRTLLALNQSTAQIFTILIANACGQAADSIQLSFFPPPDGLLPADSIYCSSIPFYLLNNQTSGVYYAWPDGSNGAQFRLDSTGKYWLKSATYCDTIVDSFKVIFNGAPSIDLGENFSICLEDSVPITNYSHVSTQTYQWSNGNTDSLIIIRDTGWYILKTTLGYCTTTDSIHITERGDCYERCKPHIANVISPNLDGINDVFLPVMICDLAYYRLNIFNRWGSKIFESNMKSVGWDGRINGEIASEGVYFYQIDFQSNNETHMREFKGIFHLIR